MINEVLLQTFDGQPVAEPTEHPRCTRCNIRLREGTNVTARFHLDVHWKLDEIYCPDCYPEVEHQPRNVETAVVEARLITRHDRVEQAATPAIHTRGAYKILRHTAPEDDQVTTGGGR